MMAIDTILIIDDEEVIKELILDTLDDLGYELITAGNGQEGLELFEKHRPILVILDLKMPVMDGIEFLRKVKLSPATSFSVIVLTGHGDDEEVKICFRLGISAFQRKPFNVYELKGLVKHSIATKKIQTDFENSVKERTRELEAANRQLKEEILIRKEMEEELAKAKLEIETKYLTIKESEQTLQLLNEELEQRVREQTLQKKIFEAINKIFQKALTCISEEDLGKTCLNVAEELTKSKFGFIGEINSKGLFDTIAISNPGWDICDIPQGKATSVIKDMPIRGVDRATMRDGESRIVNGEEAIQNHPDHIEGLEGHLPVNCFLGVPLKQEGKTIGMIGLGNKEGGYDIHDQETVEKLSFAIMEALKSKRAETALENARNYAEELNRNLEKRVQEEVKRRRKKEQLLLHQSKMAAMGEMIGAIAHQWRQPLNAVGLIVQDIKDSYEFGDLDEKYIDKMVRVSLNQLQFMSRTIDDFRNFYRTSKEKETFSVIKAVKSVISLQEAQFKYDRIGIRTANSDETESLSVSGYPNEFKQVILNIISNARSAIIDARQDGFLNEESGEILINITLGQETVNINISNSGKNIPMKIIDSIFEPYFTTKKPGEGTGIGLYMSKTIIEKNMGGKLYANNIEDGVTFTIELPAN